MHEPEPQADTATTAHPAHPDHRGSSLPAILVSAVALVRDRKMLMVTARNRDVIFMPGGKIDAGETAAQAAVREAFEEVGVRIRLDDVAELFTVSTQAHGEPEGRQVEMTVFAATTADEPAAANEINAVHWVTTADIDRCPPAGAAVVRKMAELDLID